MGRVFSGTRPAPNGTGFDFNKRVWDGFGSASIIYKIKLNLNFKIKFNLKFKINLI